MSTKIMEKQKTSGSDSVNSKKHVDHRREYPSFGASHKASGNNDIPIEQFLEQLRELEEVQPMRIGTVRRLSKLIEEGKYETEDRMDELADRLLDEML